jgi:hypothetical protein
VDGIPNGCDYAAIQAQNPRIVLSANNVPSDAYAPRQSRGHKHQHNRGSSVTSLRVPVSPAPFVRPLTPDSPPETFDPQVFLSLQQQYLELLAQNHYLVQQAQQQQLLQLQMQQQINMAQQQQIYPHAFLSPPRTPVTACLPQQYVHDSPSKAYLTPGQERYQFQSPRRSRFDPSESESSVSSAPPSDVPPRTPSPGTSPSPASSESSSVWRRGHRRGKSSISINANVPKPVQPIRQPYGPPPMETLLETKASGAQSPNFASRLRRKAVNRLMQIGLERKNGGTSPGPTTSVPQNSVQDTQEKESHVESGSEEDDPRRRSALF